MSTAELMEDIRALVAVKLADHDGCHDFDHTMRVLANAELLLQELPEADALIVRLAALLHDYARPEEHAVKGRVCHARLGAELAESLLTAKGVEPETVCRIAGAVRSHRYRGRVAPADLEAKILYDADKLDSLGAVGIGRAFLFAGRVGARLHNRREEALAGSEYSREDTAYREFLVKLNKLPGVMKTLPGRRLARERLAYMREFFDRLNAETGQSD